MADLTSHAEAPLNQAAPCSNTLHTRDKGASNSLTRTEVLHILRIRALQPEATHAQIAALVGCDRSTVSRWLADYRDTVEDARNFLQASALDAAVRTAELMQAKQDKVSLDASKAILSANKLLGNDQAQVQVGVQVVIGMPDFRPEGSTT